MSNNDQAELLDKNVYKAIKYPSLHPERTTWST
jgi:hypothetical protein